MTSVVQTIVVPSSEPEPEPEPEPPTPARSDESKSDSVSFPEPTGVHTQPGGGIRAALTELEECTPLAALAIFKRAVLLGANTLRRWMSDIFDVHGYITIKGLLSDDEVMACAGGGEKLQTLAKHPLLLDYVAELVGAGVASSPPVLLGAPEMQQCPAAPRSLLGAPGVRAPGKRTPRHRPALEGAGVRAFFVLEDGASVLAVLPGSHRSAAPAPDVVISEGGADTMLKHPQTSVGDVVLCTSTLLYGMRPKAPGNDSVPQRIASCEWVPGASKHRTLLDVETTLVAPSNETSPFSPSGSTFGHGMMWKPDAVRLEELRELKEAEDEQIRQKAWVCVAISLLLALCVAWLLTSTPELP